MVKSLGKICVQAVSPSGRNPVETLPHHPQLYVQNSPSEVGVGTNPQTFAGFLQRKLTTKYTLWELVITAVLLGLSPVSTLPIITTTTYI